MSNTITQYGVELNSQQIKAVTEAVDNLRRGNDYTICGYAGTGKTTIIHNIIRNLASSPLKLYGAVCAFTGKAALRLREKGMEDACTIHSLIYDYDKYRDTYRLKSSLLDIDYIVVDEASMISQKLWVDLLSFHKPMLLVGDPGQLEPIGKNPNLLAKPDITLDKIHRQAEQSEIVKLATKVRKGEPIPSGCVCTGIDTVKTFKRKPTIQEMRGADIIICGFNKTRVQVNTMMRLSLEIPEGIPKPGEPIIVLQNDNKFSVFNGMLLTVVKSRFATPNFDGTRDYILTVEDALGNRRDIPVASRGFNSVTIPKEYQMQNYGKKVIADFGYCITCHKSQGSEWDNVVVIDQQWDKAWDAKRWRYTAITRASKEVIYCGI